MSETIKVKLKRNIWVKVLLSILISLLLLIPACQIQFLIDERALYEQNVKREVAEKWAQRQITGALVLSVPILQKIKTKNEKGEVTISDYHSKIHFLPEELNIVADAKTTVRYRGIYKVPLYETNLVITGDFNGVDPKKLDLGDAKVFWQKAILSLGVQDVRGLKSVDMRFNERKLAVDVGAMPAGIFNSAINGEVLQDKALIEKGQGQFFIEIQMRGSEALEFYPFGQTTNVKMTSDWGSPSFNGSYLPENHEITEKRFSADWKILGLTRNLPKYWAGTQDITSNLYSSRFGVHLLIPLKNYQLNTRSVKYSILFILLTFVTMFFVEILYGIRFHPMHYGMIGGSLVLFYLLLLSFSEHLGFSAAYAMASLTTVATIFAYIYGVTRMIKSASIVLGQLSLLYGFLFILLKQESYTLIFGSMGLWVILVILMYTTRKIDWYNLSGKEPKEAL